MSEKLTTANQSSDGAVKNSALMLIFYTIRFLVRLPRVGRKILVRVRPYMERHLSQKPHVFKVRTRFGAKVICSMNDEIQSRLFYFGIWEPNVTNFIASRLHAGDCFVDVGANIGYFSLLASKCVGPKGQVIAIEASPKIFTKLQQNLSINRCKNVRAVNIAVADKKGILQLFSGPTNNIGMTSTLSSRGFAFESEVPSDRLEAILLPEEIKTAKLIKIDAEGAEAPILNTILDELNKYSADIEIAVEINPPEVLQHGITVSEIFSKFEKAGFHAYHLNNNYSTTTYVGKQPTLPLKRIRTLPVEMIDIVFSRIDAEQL